MENEIWKDVIGWEGCYQVSNFGRARSLKFAPKVRILIQGTDKKNGYLALRFCKNHNYKTKKVHRLVAKAFIENPNNYPQVNHKDGNKTNNTVPNLEWCTPAMNVRHAFDNNLRKVGYGESAPRSKLKLKDVIMIKTLSAQINNKAELGRKLGVTKYAIYSILKGETWKNVMPQI